MKFLIPDSSRPNLIHLALLVCQESTFQLYIYEYSASAEVRIHGPYPLAPSAPSSSLFAFDEDEPMDAILPDSVPLDMQALPKPGSLMIVTETDVLVYKCVFSDPCRFSLLSTCKIVVQTRSSGLERPLLCCMTCIDTTSDSLVNMLLAFDSRHLVHAAISFVPREGHVPIELNTLGRRCPTSSMAILHPDASPRFLLFCAGEMGDGEMSLVEWNSKAFVFQKKSTHANWSPMVDVRRLRSRRGLVVPESGQDVFSVVCNGPGDTGSLREIRHGIIERILSVSETEDAENVPVCTGLWPLSQNGNVSHVVASFMGETRVMGVKADVQGNQSLEDVSEDVGLECSVSTLFASAGTDQVVQVHERGITVLSQSKSEWKADKIELATCTSADVVLVRSTEPNLVHIVCHGELRESSSIHVDARLSAMCILPPTSFNSTPCLIVGGFQIPLRVLSLDGHWTCLTVHQLDEDAVVNSIVTMTFKTKTYVVVGMRNGTCSTFEWKGMLEVDCQETLGRFPVFISANQDNFAIVQCEYLWKLQIDGYGCRLLPLASDRVIDRAIPFNSNNVISFGQGHWTMSQMEQEPRMVMSKPIPFASAPRRILFYPEPLDVLNPVRQDKYIIALNPRPSHPAEIRVLDATTHRTLCSQTLATGETCLTMIEWRLKQKRYICIGTEVSDGDKKLGRIVIFSLRSIPQCVLKERTRLSMSHPVVAIAPCDKIQPKRGEEDELLLIGAGQEMLLVSECDRNLAVMKRRVLRYPVQNIVVKDFIYVATLKDSVEVYKLDGDGMFHFVASDPRQRLTSSILPTDDMVIGVDRNTNIFGLSQQFIGNSLYEAFCYTLGEIPTRIMNGSLGYRNMHSAQPTWFKRGNGDVDGNDVVYVTTVDGSMYAIVRLHEQQYSVLLDLQKRLAEYDSTKPLLGNEHARFRYPKHMQSSPRALDGDLISHFVALPPQEQALLHSNSSHDVLRLIATLNARCTAT
jgi:hypothetical protein